MKKLKIVLLVLIVLSVFMNNSFASKEDIEDKNGNGYSKYEYEQLCEKVYKVFKGEKIDNLKDGESEEDYKIENLSDKQINVLTNPTGKLLGNANTSKQQQEMRDALITEWKKRADEYGVEYDDSSDSKYSEGFKEYYLPKKTGKEESAESNLENIMNTAGDFVSDTYANDTANVSKESLQNFSNTFYGIFLAVASAVTVIVGLIIGIKYMLSSVGERANIKQMLIPYVVGCIVVYGSFGIWALVVSLLDSM